MLRNSSTQDDVPLQVYHEITKRSSWDKWIKKKNTPLKSNTFLSQRKGGRGEERQRDRKNTLTFATLVIYGGCCSFFMALGYGVHLQTASIFLHTDERETGSEHASLSIFVTSFFCPSPFHLFLTLAVPLPCNAGWGRVLQMIKNKSKTFLLKYVFRAQASTGIDECNLS